MTVSHYVRQMAQAQGVMLRQYPSHRLPAVVDSPRAPLTPKRAAFLVLRRAETLQADEKQLLQRLVEQPELASAITLTQAFAQIVRHRQFEQFDSWLEHAEASSYCKALALAIACCLKKFSI